MSENSGTDPAAQQGPSKSPTATKQEKTVLKDTPYAQAAREYLDAGWSPIPLPHRKKAAPPAGLTGYSGRRPTAEDVTSWAQLGPRNIAVRAGETVLGIDVDSYKSTGAATIAEKVAELGELPPTFRSGAREDGSGILWFRVPAGRKWKGQLGAGVEVVHHGHRYAVVGPSLHPEGMVYGWWDELGLPMGGVPHIDELPALPDAWVAELDNGSTDDVEAKASVTARAARTWVAELPGGEPCRAMQRSLDRALPGVEEPGGRHDRARDAQLNLVRMGEQGHEGAASALQTLEDAFMKAVVGDGTRSEDDALQEWERGLAGAVGRAKQAPTPEGERGCCGERTSAADDFSEPLVDAVPRRSDGEDWMMSDILPTRSYGVLDGPIGAGKSSILGHVVHRVTGKGYRVRYCVEDEPVGTARHRLELLGTDMSLVQLDEVPDLTTRQALADYAAECRSAGVDLVVFDLLASANSAYEENRPEKVKTWTKQLVEQFCTKHGLSVLGTHHWNNNSKAGSALARQSGGGALSAKAEFHWSVAMSNDRTEQVWTVHARRKISQASNRWMVGEGHFVEATVDEYEGTPMERHVYTVTYKANAGDRTAKHVADDAAKEYADGPRKLSSKDVVMEQADAVVRFLHRPRKRPEVDEFLYWLSGERYSPQTVVDRLRDVGAAQCSPEGVPLSGGKYWVAG